MQVPVPFTPSSGHCQQIRPTDRLCLGSHSNSPARTQKSTFVPRQTWDLDLLIPAPHRWQSHTPPLRQFPDLSTYLDTHPPPPTTNRLTTAIYYCHHQPPHTIVLRVTVAFVLSTCDSSPHLYNYNNNFSPISTRHSSKLGPRCQAQSKTLGSNFCRVAHLLRHSGAGLLHTLGTKETDRSATYIIEKKFKANRPDKNRSQLALVFVVGRN